jgi:hypothetical protein
MTSFILIIITEKLLILRKCVVQLLHQFLLGPNVTAQIDQRVSNCCKLSQALNLKITFDILWITRTPYKITKISFCGLSQGRIQNFYVVGA